MTTNTLGFTSTFAQMALMALRYLSGRKLRTVLTTLAIVFGVGLIFAMNLVLPGMKDAFRRTMLAASGNVDLSIRSVTGEAFAPEQPLSAVSGVKNVEAVTGSLRRQFSLPKGKASLGDTSQIELVGVDPATVTQVRHYSLAEGHFLQPGDTGKVVIPSTLVELAPQLKLGGEMPIMTTNGLKSFTIVGIVSVAGTKSRPQIIIPLADAQADFNQPGLINTIDVAFKPGADEKAVKAEIQKALGSGFSLDVSDAETALASMQTGYALFAMIGALALFIGAFLIFNTFRTVILERRRDLAMLRAIGATRRQITQMILVESLIQGMTGTLLGMIIGFLMTKGLLGAMGSMYSSLGLRDIHIYISLNASAVVTALGIGLLTTLAAGYWPARSAGRISPLDALRPSSAADVRRAARWGVVAGAAIMVVGGMLLVASQNTTAVGAVLFMIGLIVAAPGLVLPLARLFSPVLTLWFNREGDLARGNLTRQPGRAAITASTLMIGLASLILIASMVSGFSALLDNLMKGSFSSDLILTPETIAMYGSDLGADENLANRVRALPQVETVATLRYASSTYNGQTLEVLGIDPVDYPKLSPLDFADGSPSQAYAALGSGERTAIANSLTAASLGLKLGGTVTLPTAEGTQTYRIVGIANDLMHFKLDVFYISQANLKADFHKTEDVMVTIRLKPGADQTAAMAGVKTILEDYPQFTPRVISEYRKQLNNIMSGAMSFFYGLAALILFPASLGLLNTLTINVMERTREIGVVRAVGGSRRQIRRIVTAEALLLGLFGAATGILAGVAMSYGAISTMQTIGWKTPYVFPFIGILAAVIVGILLALLASILPARNAARLDIIRALQYE